MVRVRLGRSRRPIPLLPSQPDGPTISPEPFNRDRAKRLSLWGALSVSQRVKPRDTFRLALSVAFLLLVITCTALSTALSAHHTHPVSVE